MNNKININQKTFVTCVTTVSILVGLLLGCNLLSKGLIIAFAIIMAIIAVYVGKATYRDLKVFKFWLITAACFATISFIGVAAFSNFGIGNEIFIGAGAPITIPFLGACIGAFTKAEVKLHKVMAIISIILEIFVIVSYVFLSLKWYILAILIAILVSLIICFVVSKQRYDDNTELFKFWCCCALVALTICVFCFWLCLFSGGAYHMDPGTMMAAMVPVIIPLFGACRGYLKRYQG